MQTDYKASKAVQYANEHEGDYTQNMAAFIAGYDCSTENPDNFTDEFMSYQPIPTPMQITKYLNKSGEPEEDVDWDGKTYQVTVKEIYDMLTEFKNNRV